MVIALSCVAITDSPAAHHGIERFARKYPSIALAVFRAFQAVVDNPRDEGDQDGPVDRMHSAGRRRRSREVFLEGVERHERHRPTRRRPARSCGAYRGIVGSPVTRPAQRTRRRIERGLDQEQPLRKRDPLSHC